MAAIFARIACGAAVGAEAAGVAVWAARVEVARPAASARAKAWVRFIGVGELLTKFRDSRRTAVLSAGWLSAGVHRANCRAVRTSMGAREGPRHAPRQRCRAEVQAREVGRTTQIIGKRECRVNLASPAERRTLLKMGGQ